MPMAANVVDASGVLRVAVAVSSMVIRMGLSVALKRIAGSRVSLLEVAGHDEFTSRIVAFVPHVVIMDHGFADVFRQVGHLYQPDTRFALAVTGLNGTNSVGPHFDALLNVEDDEDSMRQAVAALLGEDACHAPAPEARLLSDRERQVVRGVVRGLANKEIADMLGISLFTVLTHRRNISKKLGIHSSTALALFAISNKIVNVDDVK